MKNLLITLTVLITITNNSHAISKSSCERKYEKLYHQVQNKIIEGKPSRVFNDCSELPAYYMGGNTCDNFAKLKRKAEDHERKMNDMKWDLYELSEEAKDLGRNFRCGDYSGIGHKFEWLEDHAYQHFRKMHYRTIRSTSNGITREGYENGEYTEILFQCQKDIKEELYRNYCN